MLITSQSICVVARNLKRDTEKWYITAHTAQEKENLTKNHFYLPLYQHIHGKRLDQICSCSMDPTYLIVSDYFSRFPEVIKLTYITSARVISALKSLFARYGIPEELVSDNVPQYASQEFSDFAKQYNFQHTTSSPHFPQSNGHSERAIETVKKLLSGSTDPHMALLSCHSTPLTWHQQNC